MNWITRFNERVENFRIAQEVENERKAILSRTVQNDPKLVEPTRVKVIKAFCVSGRRVEVGDIVIVDRVTADSLQAINKAEILK